MSSIEKQINDERRVTHLLCAAIDSQLELEKATEKLIKNVYKDLKRMEAAVDTLGMLTVDESRISMIEKRKVIVEAEKEFMNGRQPEEDIEEYLEVLLKEIHPNLDQIRAAARLEEEELHDLFGLSKQTAKLHKLTFDGKMKKTTVEEGEDMVKRKNKKNKKRGKRGYERKEGAYGLSTNN
ncbi:uncharacterized protein EAF02_006224 [Botrytis sinoallii]|uniref:uncharacterized protein n=1 Tax=Botrytis sinoallii TaxID=1463999 RepID=UPI0018FFC04A|nr:uncharacterized protein EAF02_006224 [Botrytis sinoallii]KAF7882861.1 hypothetical protein EAF02_006224 [Botrytis sinoallii]